MNITALALSAAFAIIPSQALGIQIPGPSCVTSIYSSPPGPVKSHRLLPDVAASANFIESWTDRVI